MGRGALAGPRLARLLIGGESQGGASTGYCVLAKRRDCHMKPALILVDIQNDYFPDGRMELVGIDEAGARAKDLLALFRERQWPVIHIQHIASSEKSTFFRPGTEGAEIHESVRPLPSEVVIQKHRPNSFRETTLLDELRQAGAEQAVICGAMSHMCVEATTRAASDLGFPCVVVHDACATRDLQFGERVIPARDVHDSFMAALGMGYADVLGFREYVERARAAEEAAQPLAGAPDSA